MHSWNIMKMRNMQIHKKKGELMKLNISSLKLAMARKQMNVLELSIISGISRNTIYYWLSNGCEVSTKLLGKAAAALEVDVTELIEN